MTHGPEHYAVRDDAALATPYKPTHEWQGHAREDDVSLSSHRQDGDKTAR